MSVPQNAKAEPVIPDWMLVTENFDIRQKSSSHFLRKTLSAFTGVFKNEFLAEKYTECAGILQSVDARVKLLTLLAYVILCSFVNNLPVITGAAIVFIIYAKMSELPLRDFLRRVWCYLPVILFVVSLPAATNFLSNGSPLFYIAKSLPFAPHGVYFTAGGVETALRAALRCGISLSFGYIIFITTPFSQLEKALRALKLPEIFVSVIGMAYRYIFVLTETASEMVEARFARTVGRPGNKEGRHFFSNSIATLFLHTKKMSEEVYDAMCCRGYTGESVSLINLKLTVQDFIFTLSNAIIILILLLGAYLL